MQKAWHLTLWCPNSERVPIHALRQLEHGFAASPACCLPATDGELANSPLSQAVELGVRWLHSCSKPAVEA